MVASQTILSSNSKMYYNPTCFCVDFKMMEICFDRVNLVESLAKSFNKTRGNWSENRFSQIKITRESFCMLNLESLLHIHSYVVTAAKIWIISLVHFTEIIVSWNYLQWILDNRSWHLFFKMSFRQCYRRILKVCKPGYNNVQSTTHIPNSFVTVNDSMQIKRLSKLFPIRSVWCSRW